MYTAAGGGGGGFKEQNISDSYLQQLVMLCSRWIHSSQYNAQWQHQYSSFVRSFDESKQSTFGSAYTNKQQQQQQQEESNNCPFYRTAQRMRFIVQRFVRNCNASFGRSLLPNEERAAASLWPIKWQHHRSRACVRAWWRRQSSKKRTQSQTAHLTLDCLKRCNSSSLH